MPPENEEPASPEQGRNRSAGHPKPAGTDRQGDTTEQMQEEILHLRRTLLGLANGIIAALGADPDQLPGQQLDRGPLPGGMPPGRRMRQGVPWGSDHPAGPWPPGTRPPPWSWSEGAMGPPPRRRRGGPGGQEEQRG
jgi:hypothetical protein